MAASNQLGIGNELYLQLKFDRIRQQVQLVEESMTQNSLEPIKV